MHKSPPDWPVPVSLAQTTKEFDALEASDIHSLSEDLTKVMRSHVELQVDHDTEVSGNAKLRIKVVTPGE